MFEDDTDRAKAQLREVLDVDRLTRRQENIVSCAGCGATLGIYLEGEAMPEGEHECQEDP